MRWIYQLNRARVVWGDKVILDDATLSFLPGAKIGVGPNGAGKSTLLRVMAGFEQPSNGDARPAPDISVGCWRRSPSSTRLTTCSAMSAPVSPIQALLARYTDITTRLADNYSDALTAEMGALQEQLDHRNTWDLDARLEQDMDALRCPPPDADVEGLSGGERRRVALCRLLLARPDLLLLDEPSNHLDAESVQSLEAHLAAYPGTVVAVTHDRYFLDNVAQRILELDRGHAYPYQGNYTTYLDTKAARLQVQGRKDAKRLRRVQRELDWVRSPPMARQAKSGARLRRYEELAAAAAKTRRLDFDEIYIPPGPRLGNLVIEAQHLSKAFGDLELFADLSFSLPRNGIVGVIGPNGVGKTTLFHMLTGGEAPDRGVIRIGETVRIAYAEQNLANIDPRTHRLGSRVRRRRHAAYRVG